MLRVLDLFSGLHGWAAPFVDRGHEVVTSDVDARFGCTVTGDFLDPRVRAALMVLGGSEGYDVILASPPCEAFSTASMGHHWGGGFRAYVPITERARTGIQLLEATLDFVRLMDAPWLIENPRGAMRKMNALQGVPCRTVTYCQYGQRNMKPTDLFGYPPASWVPRPMCKNGAPCHDAAPRGSKTGTQGIRGYAQRSLIPYELALDVCLAAERDCVRGVA